MARRRPAEPTANPARRRPRGGGRGDRAVPAPQRPRHLGGHHQQRRRGQASHRLHRRHRHRRRHRRHHQHHARVPAPRRGAHHRAERHEHGWDGQEVQRRAGVAGLHADQPRWRQRRRRRRRPRHRRLLRAGVRGRGRRSGPPPSAPLPPSSPPRCPPRRPARSPTPAWSWSSAPTWPASPPPPWPPTDPSGQS